MKKKHRTLICRCENGECQNDEDEISQDEKDVMAEMAKDAKKEEGLNGYRLPPVDYSEQPF